MKKNNLQMLNNVCSGSSLLIINKNGIFRLFCPFKAICIQDVATYVIGQQVIIIAVKMDNNCKLVYIIQNKGFYHHYFVIESKDGVGKTTA